MNYTETEIKELEKIIQEIAKVSSGLVPEMLVLNENKKFPAFNSIEDFQCRRYEDILIDNDICKLIDDWKENSERAGYKRIYLGSGGREIVLSKISLKKYLKEKEKSRNANIDAAESAKHSKYSAWISVFIALLAFLFSVCQWWSSREQEKNTTPFRLKSTATDSLMQVQLQALKSKVDSLETQKIQKKNR